MSIEQDTTRHYKAVRKLSDVEGTIKRFRKKPVVVRAVELQEGVVIATREGIIKGVKGDFLIEGVKGEVYPCGREIFFQTYDEVENDAPEGSLP